MYIKQIVELIFSHSVHQLSIKNVFCINNIYESLLFKNYTKTD